MRSFRDTLPRIIHEGDGIIDSNVVDFFKAQAGQKVHPRGRVGRLAPHDDDARPELSGGGFNGPPSFPPPGMGMMPVSGFPAGFCPTPERQAW